MAGTSLGSSSAFESLRSAIAAKTATVGIVGLGYVGLPLVRVFLDAGFPTMGFDVDSKKIDCLGTGKSYIKHIAEDWIARGIESERFIPTANMARLSEADAILICVPTPLTSSRDPDLTYVESTARMIADNLRPGQLIILESTTYPGTTRDVIQPVLAATGLKLGTDYFLAYSPEREDPGNADYSTSRIPKVVGGMEPSSLAVTQALYEHATFQTVAVASAEVAEACKILENTYRSINIAMVNELKILFQRIGIDIWEVIDAAKTKPFGFQAFYPGPGLGGHCIPIDPFYLSWLARKHEMPTRFIELAGEINTAMPEYVVSRVARVLNDFGKPVRNSRVAILGMAYKKDIDDPRESPSFKLMELLQEHGAILSYNDPFIPTLPSMRHYQVPDLASESLTPEYLAAQDCVLIATDHTQYDWEAIVRHSQCVIDTRNATHAVVEGREKIYKA